ncbi:MAG: hypothetical protein PVJ67_03735 [Candidatus Pacearchaeota archaeon]
MTGWIEKIDTTYDVQNHTITISGRDITCDIVDSQPDMSKIEFKKADLITITKKILEILNLQDIKIINRFNLKKFSGVSGDSIGTTAYDFLSKYAKKSQVLLTTNGNGYIVFERAKNEIYNTVLSTDKNALATILNSSCSYDNTKRFYHYNLSTSASINDFIGKPSEMIKIKADAYDKEIRKSRILYIEPPDNSDQDETEDTAKWEANFRRANSVIYNCEVQGFIPKLDNEIWKVNKLVKVFDQSAGLDGQSIDANLLITEVTYSQSVDDGSKTNLILMIQDAFTLQVNRPQKNKKSGKVQDDFN